MHHLWVLGNKNRDYIEDTNQNGMRIVELRPAAKWINQAITGSDEGFRLASTPCINTVKMITIFEKPILQMSDKIYFLRHAPVMLMFIGSCLLTSGIHAQEPNHWKTYTVEDGLAGTGMMAQDAHGFLWMVNGMRRFDGYAVKSYKEDPNDSLGFHLTGAVKECEVDNAGDIWIQDGNEMRRYDFEKDGFVSYPAWTRVADLIRKRGQVGFSTCLAGSKTGLWIGGEDLGLVYFDPTTGEVQEYSNRAGDSLITHERNSIHKIFDKGASLLCATHDGLWRFDKAKKVFIRPVVRVTDSILLNRGINKMYQVGNNYWFIIHIPRVQPEMQGHRLMVQTDSSFAILRKIDFPLTFAEQGGSGAEEATFAIDSNNIFWASTVNKGLLRFDLASGQSTYYANEPGNPYSLPSSYILNVYVDRDQNVWVSTDKGLSRLIRKRLDFYNYTIGTGPKGGLEFLKGKKSDYLLAASGLALWSADTHNKAPWSLKFQRHDIVGFSNDVVGIGRLAKGRTGIWARTNDNAFGTIHKLSIDPETGIIDGRAVELNYLPQNIHHTNLGHIIHVVEDEEQNLWITKYRKANKGQLVKVAFTSSGEVDTVLNFLNDPADPNSIHKNGVWNVFWAGKDSLFVTTGGLDLFHNGRFEHIFSHAGSLITSTRDGKIFWVSESDGTFEGKKVNGKYNFSKINDMGDINESMQEDRLGRYWYATDRGIFLYSPREQTEQRFNIEDGLEGSLTGTSAQTSEGMMAFGSEKGLIVFDPMTRRVSKSNPKPLITQLRISGKPALVEGHTVTDDDFVIPKNIGELSELLIDYTHNFFSLEFAAIEFADPEKNRYTYKLEGFNKDWILADWKNRSVTYMNLNPGSYTFRVKATNYDGIWSDNETTLAITVLPPPWRTWWAYTGYGLLAVSLLLLARRNVVQRERLKSSLALSKVEQEKEHFELEKAKEVDKVKTSFFTNISHEFRTPLTLIKGPVEALLERFKNDADVIKRLKLVQRNSDLLLKLINQLLDLAKLETGTLKVEKSEGDLNSFIGAITNSFSSFAAQKNIEIKVGLPETRHHVLFDKDKVETILINLINNAIKFTPVGGRVNISAAITPTPWGEGRGEGGEGLTLIVKDTGIGIPLDQQTKIFERFHQVSEAHKEVGTGIGLALVKELVNLMGGTITVKSEPGKGSEFTVTLPVEIASEVGETITPGAVSQEPTAPDNYRDQRPEGISNKEYQMSPARRSLGEGGNDEADPSKPHVLVVEDNADLRGFIIDSLGNEFHFLEAGDGKQGLEIATREVPDLIISDVMMPEMDGMEMLSKIKGDIRTSHIPVILLTAKSTEDSKLSGLQSGADDYLTKPFNKNELLLKVRNRVTAQAKMREKIKLELLKESPRVEVQSADEQFLMKVKDAIHERLSDEQLSVESLAEEIGLSRVQLYRKVTALTGVSVNELIRTFRLQKAAQLLEQNWGPVSQVAYEVGFSNLSYFSKVFKEEYGVLPSEYTVKT